MAENVFTPVQTKGSEDSFLNAASALKLSTENLLPSIQSLDTASNRLQSRIAAKGASDRRAVLDQSAGFGRSGSGFQNQQLAQARAANTQALRGGLTDLQQQFEENRLRGGGLLAQTGQAFTDLGKAQAAVPIEQFLAGVSGFDADTGRFAAETDRNLGEERNRIDSLRQALEETLGLGELDLRKDSAQLGAILDAITAFAPEGAGTPFDSSTKQGQFDRLISQLFGAIGTIGDFGGDNPLFTQPTTTPSTSPTTSTGSTSTPIFSGGSSLPSGAIQSLLGTGLFDGLFG